MGSNLILHIISLVAYSIGLFAWIIRYIKNVNRSKISFFTDSFLAFGCFSQTIMFFHRWYESGRAPLVNLYEVCLFFALSIALLYLIIKRVYFHKSQQDIASLDLSGCWISIFAILLLSFTLLLDPKIEPLVPALQSRWLKFHVLTCFAGYAAFALAFFAAITYLLCIEGINSWSVTVLISIIISSILTFIMYQHTKSQGLILTTITLSILLALTITIKILANKILLKYIDIFNTEKLIFSTIGIGFIFLTLGIITGSIWANRAWGTYWSWDPKETWSLITWFIYSLYLHLTLIMKKNRVFTAWIAVSGFIAVLITWLGVNYLFPGLHSYG